MSCRKLPAVADAAAEPGGEVILNMFCQMQTAPQNIGC